MSIVAPFGLRMRLTALKTSMALALNTISAVVWIVDSPLPSVIRNDSLKLPPVTFGLMVTVCRLLMPALTVAPLRIVAVATFTDAFGLGTRPVVCAVSVQRINCLSTPAWLRTNVTV